MTIKKVHFLSGLTIGLFVGFHLLNHFTSILGADAHIEWMDKFRVIYRNPIIETMLLLAVIVQIISGINLFFKKKKSINNPFEKLQIWSGLYLAFFLLIHVSAVLVGRTMLELDTNFYFGVAGLNSFPTNLFFIPYYALAICAFFGHIASIHHQKMKKQILGLTVEHQAKIILILGIIITIAIFYGLTNQFNGVEIPEAYHILIGK